MLIIDCANISGDTRFLTAVMPPEAFADVIADSHNVTVTGIPFTDPTIVTSGSGTDPGM